MKKNRGVADRVGKVKRLGEGDIRREETGF